MTKTTLQFTLLFVVLVLMQAVVFNHICLFNVAVPFVFIYFILRLPVNISPNWILTLGFLIGLCVDIFADTQGVNALACTILAMSRRSILQLYFPREDELSIPIPSISSLGLDVYLKYLFTSVLIYCTLIFVIESCSLFNYSLTIARIITSSILTFLLLLGLDGILGQRSA
ncbi:MAG: rod shape-determining protein MreD [Muribaculum sp.]|nr:rod shape-determining protein MreD [Muribaculum sp.]